MKRILFLILMIGFSTACKEKAKSVSKPVQLNIDSLEKEAIANYSQSPQTAINLFMQIADYARSQKDHQKSGTTFLNIAGLYEEQLHDLPKALKYGKESLKDWETLNDTMQIANLKKYTGLLEGLNGNYKSGVNLVEEAIQLYKAKNFESGVAVSKINMARIKLLENKLVESKKYFQESKTYWENQQNLSRVFDNNLVGIEIHNSLGDTISAQILVRENKELITSTQINEYLLKKFESLIK